MRLPPKIDSSRGSCARRKTDEREPERRRVPRRAGGNRYKQRRSVIIIGLRWHQNESVKSTQFPHIVFRFPSHNQHGWPFLYPSFPPYLSSWLTPVPSHWPHGFNPVPRHIGHIFLALVVSRCAASSSSPSSSSSLRRASRRPPPPPLLRLRRRPPF